MTRVELTERGLLHLIHSLDRGSELCQSAATKLRFRRAELLKIDEVDVPTVNGRPMTAEQLSILKSWKVYP